LELWVQILLFLSSVLAVSVLLLSIYHGTLTSAYLASRFRSEPIRADTDTTFSRLLVLIPAHEEEQMIGGAIRSIQACDYPRDRVSILVAADGCSDRTAMRARELGVRVIERQARDPRGKGSTLSWALSHLDLSASDAVVIIDADCIVDGQFLRQMNAALAGGKRVVQGYNGLSNPNETRLTQLMSVFSVMKNLFFAGGQASLGFSPFLMGTGMAFFTDVLRNVPWTADSLSECIEQSLYLIARGERIHFEPRAVVRAHEAPRLRLAYGQRRRWSSGQIQLRVLARRMLTRAWHDRNWDLLHASLVVIAPLQYSKLVNLALVSLGLGIVSTAFAAPMHAWQLVALGAALGIQLAEVTAGLVVLSPSAAWMLSLLVIPGFLLWKAWIDVIAELRIYPASWVRTDRL
jgi:cellulose synthase/poly-beta-1,6-N-acetylglucosamine synthase-like glycosyltransferase